MSTITRRNFFKFLTLSAGATLVANANEDNNTKSLKAQNIQLKPKKSKAYRVVVIGGGMGGLTVAQSINANDPKNKIEVIVLERNTQYFASPMSNTLFGEIKNGCR
jgi:cell division GTPase FtsZ